MNKLVALAILPLFLSGCMISQKKAQLMLNDAIENPYDVIVVPGVPYEGKEISTTMQGRVYWSKYLFDKGLTKNIIYSGSCVYSPYYESKVMGMMAEQLGIPDSVIYYESRAEHSTENIYYSYKLAKLLGFERIALATDPFQSKMLKKYIKEIVDPEVGMIPMVYDSMVNVEHIDFKIDSARSYEQNFVSIVKRESWWKRFRGTRGHNVKEDYYSSLQSEGMK